MDIYEYFKKDRYAELVGIVLLEAKPGCAKASLKVEEKHLNANGLPQGGVLFTLADFVTGVASNSHGELAVSVNANISFLQSCRPGDLLTAEAIETSGHKRLATYRVTIHDQNSNLLITMDSTVYKKPVQLDFGKPAL